MKRIKSSHFTIFCTTILTVSAYFMVYGFGWENRIGALFPAALAGQIFLLVKIAIADPWIKRYEAKQNQVVQQ